jgi:hypothetical protein
VFYMADGLFSVFQEGTVGAEDVWISCYQAGKDTVHAKIRVMAGDAEGDVELEARDGVEVDRLSNVRPSFFFPLLGVRSSLKPRSADPFVCVRCE